MRRPCLPTPRGRQGLRTCPAQAAGLPAPVAAELISVLAAVALAGTITGPPP